VAALVLGKRKGWPREPMLPHNLTLTVLGAGLLWFGWFGFNAGSALAASPLAASAFMATQAAAAAATLTWVLAEWIRGGKPTTLGAASGAVAGLVAITPCAGFVRPWPSLVIGGVAGVICYLGVSLKNKFLYDDSLDVVGVHLIGGLWGSLAVGLFAHIGVNGLFYGNAAQLGKQAVAVGATLAWSGVITFVLLKALDATLGLRVTEDEEVTGLDLALHDESGYNLTPVGTMLGGSEEV
jgi:Amt family ammonium transporter